MTSMIRRLLNGDDSSFLHFLETGERLCCISVTKEGAQCDMMGEPLSEKSFKVYCKKCIAKANKLVISRRLGLLKPGRQQRVRQQRLTRAVTCRGRVEEEISPFALALCSLL